MRDKNEKKNEHHIGLGNMVDKVLFTFEVFPCFPENGYVIYGVGDVKFNKNI